MNSTNIRTLIDQYFHEIENSVGLPAQEEIRLAKLLQQGDEEASQKLVQANLRFVASVAKQYQNLGLPLLDLIGEGNVGLITAVRRFDPNRGFKLISYAVWWIRQAILQALAEQSRIMRLPLNRIGELIKINKVWSKLEQKLGYPPSVGELAREIEEDFETVDDLFVVSRVLVSMDEPLSKNKKGEDDRTIGDFMADPSVPDIHEQIGGVELRKAVEQAMDDLTENEVRVLRMYYGLDGCKPMTLEQIGAYMGRTRERVRQIRERALQKLRHPARCETLREFYGPEEMVRKIRKKDPSRIRRRRVA